MLHLVTILFQNFTAKIPFADHLRKLSIAVYQKLNTVFHLKHLHHDFFVNHHNDMLTLHFEIEAIFPTVRFR